MKLQIKIMLCLGLLPLFIGCAFSSEDRSKPLKWKTVTSRYDDHPSVKVTQSEYRDSIGVVYWNGMATEKKSILGQWEGIGFEGKKVTYQFKPDGRCDWTVEKEVIQGRYEIQEEEKLYRIKMDSFNVSYLDDVEFHGIFKLQGEEMMFYGVTVKDVNDLNFTMDAFNGNALLLKKKEL